MWTTPSGPIVISISVFSATLSPALGHDLDRAVLLLLLPGDLVPLPLELVEGLGVRVALRDAVGQAGGAFVPVVVPHERGHAGLLVHLDPDLGARLVGDHEVDLVAAAIL